MPTTTPVTTKPSSITSRLRSCGVVHAALSIQSDGATKELDERQRLLLVANQALADEATPAGYREIFVHLAVELAAAKDGMISANSRPPGPTGPRSRTSGSGATR